jgi:hypothetical protein
MACDEARVATAKTRCVSRQLNRDQRISSRWIFFEKCAATGHGAGISRHAHWRSTDSRPNRTEGIAKVVHY